MSYAQTANRANPAAMLGALGVPAAFGAVLIIGLAVKVTMNPAVPNPIGVTITPTLPEDPPPPPEPQEQQAQTNRPQENFTYVQPPRDDFTFTEGPTTIIDTFPSFGEGEIGPVELPGNLGKVTPALADPIKAAPRGNPGGWVTDSDYRSNWIRKELTGSASFLLNIDSRGKVTNCTITRSTGHSELDNATCTLIAKRAKFEPAKDGNGNAVAGTYANTVNWRIPE